MMIAITAGLIVGGIIAAAVGYWILGTFIDSIRTVRGARKIARARHER